MDGLLLGGRLDAPLRYLLYLLQAGVDDIETALHVDLHHAGVIEVLGLALILDDVLVFDTRVRVF